MMKNDQDKINEKVQGKQDESFSEATSKLSESIKKNNADNNKFSKNITESITKSFESFKDITRPGSMLKTAGLMTGSPILMTLGESLNNLIDKNKEESNDTITEDEKQFKTLEQIETNTEPDFEAEQRNNEQIERDNKQLSYLEKMVESFNSFGDTLKELGKNSFFEDILSLAGLTLGIILAPFILISGFFSGLKETLTWMINGISKTFKGLKNLFKWVFKIGDKVEESTKLIKSSTGGFFSKIGKFFQWFKNIGLKIGQVLKNITPFSNTFLSISKSIFSIGKLMGKIFPIITAVWATFDTIKGALKGFETDGWIGAIKGGITGLINNLVSAPLDLLKSLTGWILGKFNFKNAEETLKSFSFKELFTNMIDSLFNSIKMIVEFIKNLFTWEIPKDSFNIDTLFSDAITKIFNWFKELLDIDFNSIVENIPGYSLFKKVTGLFSSKDNNQDKNILENLDKNLILKQSVNSNNNIQKLKLEKEKKTQRDNAKNSKNSNINNISNTNNNIITNTDMSVSTDDKSFFQFLGA